MTQLSKDKKRLVYDIAQDCELLYINQYTGYPMDLKLKSKLEKFAIRLLEIKEKLENEEPNQS